MRINKYIGNYLGISRRQADHLIEKELVTIDGRVAVLGDQVGLTSKICYKKDNKWEQIDIQKRSTILYYKPIFSLVSARREGNKKTIYDSLPPKYRSFKPAGRLDYMSEGLLVMSQDGDLLHTLTHPKHNTLKKYVVGLNEQLKLTDINDYRRGIVIDDYQLRSVDVTPMKNSDIKDYYYLKLDSRKFWYFFNLNEGRNNQIRKMCSKKGYSVYRLIRCQHGEYALTEQLRKQKFLEI